jgi:hypothetical protein
VHHWAGVGEPQGTDADLKRLSLSLSLSLCPGTSANASGTQALFPERGLTVLMGMIDADADAVLSLLLDGLRRVLGVDLVGSYPFGSAATGTFEPGSSDVDTVAVLRSDPTETHLEGLEELHAGIVRRGAEISQRTLPSDRGRPPVADGLVSAVGTALYGPPVTQVAPPITQDEYVDAVRQHLLDPGWLDSTVTARDRSYAILTMCRGLRTLRTGEYVSKREGARWASEVMPEHAALITNAVAWRGRREDGSVDPGLTTQDATRRFVVDVQRRL